MHYFLSNLKVSPGTPEEESIPPPGTPPVVPTFLLPPERVIITQPTPETEFPSNGTYSNFF